MREFFKRFRRAAQPAPSGERGEVSRPDGYPFTASMPDIRKKIPDMKCNGKKHVLALFSDVPSLSGLGMIHYNYVVAIFVHPGTIIGFITLERSESMQNAFCLFDERGKHHNFGDLSDEGSPSDADILKGFLSGAGMALRDKFGIYDNNWEPFGSLDGRYDGLIPSAGRQ